MPGSRFAIKNNPRSQPRPVWEQRASLDIAEILSDDTPEHIKILDLLDLIEEYADWLIDEY